MFKATAEAVNLTPTESRRPDPQEIRSEGLRSVSSDSKSKGGSESLDTLLRPDEKDLVRQLVQDLRSIRYGSIVLVMHEGRLVEVSKTIRVRKSQRSESEREREDKR